MAFPIPQVTAAGRALLTKVMDGEALEFTKIKMGSGTLTDISADKLTNLIYTEATIDINQILKGEDYVSIRGIFSNEDITSGFYWKEVGLFAKDPNMGEILFAYSNAGNTADYISPAEMEEIVRTIVMVISLSNASNITIIIDNSLTYATSEDLKKLSDAVNEALKNMSDIIQQVTGVDPDDPDAEPPSGSMVVTLTHSKSGTVHQFTGLEERTGLVPCQFKSTAGYTEGDTAIIDGTAYTITLTSADTPETDLFVSGKSILIDVDTEGKLINFKSGGGLTNGKLALADATEDTVFNGRTFYAGDKTLRTGRALATPITAAEKDVVEGLTYYDQSGQLRTGTRKRKLLTEIIDSSRTYTVPDNVTQIFVRIFGGGGGGGSLYSGQSAGGGGGYMTFKEINVTPKETIYVTIGNGGNVQKNGGTSSFGSYVSAQGGYGANGPWAGNGGSGGGGGGSSGNGYVGTTQNNFGGGNAGGGHGDYGGGGGGGSLFNGNSSVAPQCGGNGGTYGGGGGGGAMFYSNQAVMSGGYGGSGGTYGGNGGNGGCYQDDVGVKYSGSYGSAGTNTVGMGLDFEGTGNRGAITVWSGYYNFYGSAVGGGGGGGYGGDGGTGGYIGGGGGGGYGGKGGNGIHGANDLTSGTHCGGGGGGYGGDGGDGGYGCGGGGGGYGPNGKGGTGSSKYTGVNRNGGYAAGGAGYGGLGGGGICIVSYYEP